VFSCWWDRRHWAKAAAVTATIANLAAAVIRRTMPAGKYRGGSPNLTGSDRHQRDFGTVAMRRRDIIRISKRARQHGEWCQPHRNDKDPSRMRLLKRSAVLLASLLLLSACASEPLGPTIGVMPAPGKPFDVFQSDQALCRQFAADQIQGGAQQANNRQVGTAVVGTLLGAGLGAAIGGGRGAAVGAGAGALGGTAVGAGPSGQAQYSLQQQYNLGYAQCMYSRGNQVPGYQPPGAPPPGYAPSYPPPPPGYAPSYPPPPPGYYR
jgi:hypothetical protein